MSCAIFWESSSRVAALSAATIRLRPVSSWDRVIASPDFDPISPPRKKFPVGVRTQAQMSELGSRANPLQGVYRRTARNQGGDRTQDAGQKEGVRFCLLWRAVGSGYGWKSVA